MEIHDVHDFDARLAGREMLKKGFCAVDDISGRLVDCAEDELLDELDGAADDMDIVIDEVATTWGPVFVFRDRSRVALSVAKKFVLEQRPRLGD